MTDLPFTAGGRLQHVCCYKMRLSGYYNNDSLFCMLPRLYILTALCLSPFVALAEATGSDVEPQQQVELEQEETRRTVLSEEEDPQSQKSVERREDVEEFIQQKREQEVDAEMPPDSVEAETPSRAMDEVRSEEEEPRIEPREDILDGVVADPLDGKIYGRGAVDAKGALAAFVWAAKEMKDSIGKEIGIIGAVEEEVSSSAGARNIIGEFNPRYAIIGEPSGWNGITLGYKGNLHIEYIVRQEKLHFSGKRITAAENGVQFWTELKNYCDEYKLSIHRKFFL